MLATDTEYIVKWKLYLILYLGNWLLVIRETLVLSLQWLMMDLLHAAMSDVPVVSVVSHAHFETPTNVVRLSGNMFIVIVC